ncbi:hypothetical protein MBM_05111 [Drepanopeziza brunnea f. sp. 'multigermtubi' MB_m1]|uniref:Uncharacterized protein n=1 Tax=Marssonina brunnea f. sp. multigermtubi (strain MB_m1) TaxID=1072389 RepID=K1WW30_MARBU|nr:uncharacterized protein MBM_05111 [Drepanopeziza brunnea f. sp. 'multigermtubi' MB_m1]EKD16642.1 hypothetical protein MBM_05111 [Drepanopeziza brunnea f. sp. 'multigermtubi' MB_m1]
MAGTLSGRVFTICTEILAELEREKERVKELKARLKAARKEIGELKAVAAKGLTGGEGEVSKDGGGLEAGVIVIDDEDDEIDGDVDDYEDDDGSEGEGEDEGEDEGEAGGITHGDALGDFKMSLVVNGGLRLVIENRLGFVLAFYQRKLVSDPCVTLEFGVPGDSTRIPGVSKKVFNLWAHERNAELLHKISSLLYQTLHQTPQRKNMIDEPVKSRGLDSKKGAKRDREKDQKRDPKNRDKDTKREGSQTPSGKGSLNKVKKHDGNFEDIARSAVPRSSAFRDTPRVSEPIKKKKQHKPPLEFESVIPPKPPAPTQNTHRQPMHAASASTSSATKIMTAYTSPQDIEMAESQLRIQSLHGEERVRQEKWAIEKLSHHGACPAGYKWHPYNKGVDTRGRLLDGYRCRGGNHMITHAIVAGGRNDYYCSAANLAFLVQLQWQCTALSPLQTPPPMRYPGMQAPLGMIMVLGQQQFQQVQMQQPMHFIQQPGQPILLKFNLPLLLPLNSHKLHGLLPAMTSEKRSQESTPKIRAPHSLPFQQMGAPITTVLAPGDATNTRMLNYFNATYFQFLLRESRDTRRVSAMSLRCVV